MRDFDGGRLARTARHTRRARSDQTAAGRLTPSCRHAPIAHGRAATPPGTAHMARRDSLDSIVNTFSHAYLRRQGSFSASREGRARVQHFLRPTTQNGGRERGHSAAAAAFL